MLSPEAAARFFLRGGLALGAPKLTSKVSLDDDSAEGTGKVDTAAGFDVAAGVQYNTSPTLAVFGEVTYAHLLTKDKKVKLEVEGETSEDEADSDTQWVAIKVGVAIFLGGE